MWTGCVVRRYGQMRWHGERHRTHRLSWILANGPIPDGLWVLHHCDVPLCVNPAHLFLGTVQDNKRDEVAKGRQLRGTAHPSSKCDPETVRRVRWLYSGGWTPTMISRLEGNVTVGMVPHIVTGRSWGHIPRVAPTPQSDRLLALVTETAKRLGLRFTAAAQGAHP